MAFTRHERPDWKNLPLDQALTMLKDYLQQAVQVELYTIPMYLYAAYSIKDRDPRNKIIGVVREEMLHLGLAGNILCSIGGTPRLYGADYTPHYPETIFNNPVEMNLAPGTKETIEIFRKVEAPAPSPVVAFFRVLPDNPSIGDFYDELREGLTVVHSRFDEERHQDIFLKDTFPKQFNAEDGSWIDDDMKVIESIKIASDSLELIITQGEGPGEGSHYNIFDELFKGTPWANYNVVKNINPEDYSQERFYKLMNVADASYSYLLISLERLWTYAGPDRQALIDNNIGDLMRSILKPLALFLVQQKITGETDKYAAAPYRLYKFGENPFKELGELTKEALDKYRSGGVFDPALGTELVNFLKKVESGVGRLTDLGQLRPT